MDDSAYRDFVAWLSRVRRSSPPPDGIAAYNFGLFESVDSYMAYLIGSRDYDPDDEDWACAEDYAPDEKYFPLPEDLTAGKDWRSVQREVARLVRQYLKSPEASGSFLAAATAVTVGFDDGNLERIA